MKKTFVEPAMHRIELNLRENIAASEGPGSGSGSGVQAGYYFNVELLSCTIQTTGKFVWEVNSDEARACLVLYGTKSLRMFYPREEVLPHFKS